MENEVQFRVLGCVGVSVNGAPLAVGASRQRALLALLLLDANRRVHPHVLIEGIWGEAVPEHPEAALQIVVSRLRKALRPVAERLTSDPGGYRIDVADSEFDLLRARVLLARAKELAELQDDPGCADATEAALALWNGDALADLREVPFYDTAHRELRDLQLSIYELRNRAYLRTGRHLEVLADIETWVRAEPWRERLRAHHMVALYRAGLRVDALAAYDDLCRGLRRDLGVEPSLFTQELHAQIVDQDPALLAQHAGIVATLPAWTPRGLPFVGRSNEEARILACLRDVAAGASRMVLVEGEAGIGKSRLVLEAAQRVHDSAIIIPIDGADALRPGLQKVAGALADASAQLSDAELRLCLGRWPGDVADVVPALRRRLPDLPAALEADDEVRGARLRSAIVSWIGAMSQRAPVLFLVDDVHRSGPALLLLIGSLLVSDDPKRVLVLATARSGGADQSTRLVHLSRSLEQRGIFERVRLSGLSTEAVGYILAGIGVPDAARLAPDLARSTSGHPYLLSEMLREPHRISPPSHTDDVAGRIRGFVLRRVATLGEASSQLLSIAAALDGEFDVGLLSEIVHGTEPSTAALIDEVINGGFLHVTGLGSFDFVHDLTRRTIAEATDEDDQGRLHAEIARVLERRGATAALVGAQWSRATGPEADHQTRVWAERAGKDALRVFDPYAAAAWFALAAERATEPRVRGYLLILLAGAQCQCGGPAGGATLRAALEIAHELDDGEMVVEAASLSGPIWTSLPALSHEERVDLLGDGASRAQGDGVRARLLARLATELSPTPEWRRARALAEEARALATRAGDKAIVAEVSMRHFQATWTPHNVAERRREIFEAAEIARAENDPLAHFFTLSMSAGLAIETADLDQAEHDVDDAFAIAAQVDVPVLEYNARCIRVWRAGLAGDLAEAERLAHSAMRYGMSKGIEYAVVGPSLQIGGMRWQQGRIAEVLPILRMQWLQGDLNAAILLARALADADETRAEGAAVLERAAERDFADLPLGVQWSATLLAAAQASFMLGNARVGRLVFEHLEPFAEYVAFNGSWVFAPLALAAGLGAAIGGIDAAVADQLFEQAISVCERVRAPMLRVHVEMGWSHALQARDAFPEKARALTDAARRRCADLRIDLPPGALY